jgi:hypothetical protein
MKTILFYLVPAETGWSVRRDDLLDRFDTLTAALRASYAGFRNVRDSGDAAQILVARPDGAWEVVDAWEPAADDLRQARPPPVAR